MARPQEPAGLEQEIAAEKLSALARATRALESALEALARAPGGAGAGHRPEGGAVCEDGGGGVGAGSGGAGDRPRDRPKEAGQGSTRQRLLDEAGHRLWMAVVQREAMGLTRHEILIETLRVPPEVRRRMAYRPGF